MSNDSKIRKILKKLGGKYLADKITSTPFQIKKENKQKMLKNNKVLTQKDYKNLTESQKLKFDVAKETKNIPVLSKFGTSTGRVTIYDSESYKPAKAITRADMLMITGFGMEGKTTAKNRFKQFTKENLKKVDTTKSKKTYSTKYGKKIGIKPKVTKKRKND